MKKKRCKLNLAAACTAAILMAGAAFAFVNDNGRLVSSERVEAKTEQRESARQPSERRIATAKVADVDLTPVRMTRVPVDQVRPASNIRTMGGGDQGQGGIAGSVCGPGNGDCCNPLGNGTPGCDNVDCCTQVCSFDPFCCDSDWDGGCAGQAEISCLVCQDEVACGDPGTGNCCIAHGTAFCSNAECCEYVCSQNPSCCDFETGSWDAACVAIATDPESGCDVCQLPPDGILFRNIASGPFSLLLHLENEIVADDLQMVIGGNVEDAGFSFGNGEAPSNLLSVTIELHFWNAELDGTAILPPVDGEQDVVLTGTFDFSEITGICESETPGVPPLCAILEFPVFFDAIELDQIVWAGVRFTAANFAGGGTTEDLFQVLPEQAPTTGFSADALWSSIFNPGGFFWFEGDPVANTSWSILSADVELSCGAPGAGDCFSANPTPFCNDATCCNAVCACDPFCCAGFWDTNCAGPNLEVPNCSALDLCDPSGPQEGACTISNCPADLTGNNNVGVPDLLALLAAWGPCPAPCAADLTGNGNVGVPDLLALLAAWGPCPAPTCQVLSADDCAAAGGAYQGDGSTCP